VAKQFVMKICVLLSFLLVTQNIFSQDTITRREQDTLTRKDFITGQKFLDLSFTEAEIDSMYFSVRNSIREIKKMHGYHLGNEVPMSLAHSPILPGMKFNKVQAPVKWNLPVVNIPTNKNELAFYSILQLASLIKNKKISSVELTRFFINRLKKYDDSLHCVISVTEDIALQQATQADKEIAAGKYRGPLHGIPYGLKDLFAVKGTKTTWGAAPYKEQIIDEDSYVYTRLKDAGAILVVKFTLGALAMGDYWYGGRTRNPWNPRFGSSGSSAGSTSATVAGLIPFAIGTETLGSIISPSSTCGATGLRPTFGAISRSGGMVLSWSMDKPGPICRSAEDAAVVFNYIHGTDGKDASAVNMPFNYSGKTDLSKLKIAYAKNYLGRRDTMGNELEALEAFRKAGAQLIPVDFPDSGIYNFNMTGLILNAEAAAAFDELTRTDLDDQLTRQGRGDWPNSFRSSRFIPAVDYINANRHRYLLMKRMDEFMSKYDVVICPTFAGSQLRITNLTGHPAICMPTGFNRNKLPTSITLVGKLYDEATLLAVAKAYQQATQWDEMHPDMFK
jgi:Asp-tRNA(Asn)/Glu-tRNA(Gln) amidotransferase A subunit family amidase